ncbi:MAG TPA: acyl-CoA dehydrogenase [Burkholderiaceae bacterium]|nr:acyl-CoA dehydrogenase [Burkholderiaceae bacterium]
MSYSVPIKDIRFIMHELADLKGMLALPDFAEISEDLVDAILQENARFVEEKIVPLNTQGDQHPASWHEGEVRSAPGFKEVFHEFVQAGWQGLQHDARFGGQGLPRLVGAAAVENINAASLAFSLCPLLTDGVIDAVSLAGTAEQQETYLPPMLEGRWTGTMNLTEPQAGSDLALLTTRAVPQQDGSYRLSGEKIFITYGDHDMAENIVHLVLARTPNAPRGVKGISLFLVPKYLVNADGSLGKRNDVYCASLEHKLGVHGSPTTALLYGAGKGEVGEGAVGYLIGEECRGLEYMFITMNAARYAVGIQGVAISERSLQQAQAYAAERIQSRAVEGSGSVVPIARHPDVQRMLGIMRGLTEGARAVAYVAASCQDRATHETDLALQKQYLALYEYFVPIVKAFCTESAIEVVSLGLQVHGGMGYIEETGAAQHYRDARILPIYEGTTAIQANDFIGRKIARDGAGVAQAQVSQMLETVMQLRKAEYPDSDGLHLIADRLEQAARDYQASLDHILAMMGENIRGAFMGSVPCLMQAGTVHAGWQLARSALAAAKALHDGSSDAFHTNKITTAVMYAVHVLPRVGAFASTIADGAIAERYAGRATG